MKLEIEINSETAETWIRNAADGAVAAIIEASNDCTEEAELSIVVNETIVGRAFFSPAEEE